MAFASQNTCEIVALKAFAIAGDTSAEQVGCTLHSGGRWDFILVISNPSLKVKQSWL